MGSSCWRLFPLKYPQIEKSNSVLEGELWKKQDAEGREMPHLF